MKTRRDLLRRIVAMALCMFIVTGMFGICSSAAESETEGWLSDEISWKVSVEKGELRIAGNGAIRDFESSTEEYPWSSVSGEIFSLVIEDGITSIGRYVFYNLPHLNNVTFGNTLEVISSMAFYYCLDIENIHIPKSVKQLDGSSFFRCGLKKITVDEENENYCANADGVLFSKDMSTIVLYPRAVETTSYTIPDGVQTIGSYAFAYAPIDDITIPYGVTSIEYCAFSYDTKLTDVALPETVKVIGTTAFEGCHNLKNINIPDGIESIGDFAFSACLNLSDIELPDKIIKIGRAILRNTPFFENTENWFDGGLYCGNHLLQTSYEETDVFITKEGTIDVASCAFISSGAKTVIIADSVRYVGNKSFWGNRLTERVIFYPSVETIGGYAFWGADVKQVIIHEGVEEIGSFSFWGADNIETLTIPSSITALPKRLFFGASSLKTLYLYNTIESIENDVFYSTDSLTDIYYYGTKDEWDSIDMVENTIDESVTIHYLGDLSDHVHDFKDHIDIEASCIEIGFKAEICNICGLVSVVGIYDALGHNYGDWVVTKPATETEKGVETSTCERCGDIQERELDVIAHEHKFEKEVVESTCTTGGYTVYTCSCGDRYRADYTAVLGHWYGDWIIITEPTETQKGLKARYCRRCEHEQTRSIDSTGHKHDYTETVTYPTCTTEGFTTYTCECGDTYTGNVVKANGHRFTDWVVTKMPTFAEDGLEMRECRSCDVVETRVVTVETHKHEYNDYIVTEPNCTDVGYTTYICACGYTTIEDLVPELGHDFGDWTVTKEPTETERGKRERTCERCGRIEEQSIGMLPPTSDTALIKVGDVTARPGKTVEVTVSIENNPGIVATHLMLRYDSDILTLSEVRDGGLFGTAKMVAGNDLTDIPYNVIWSDALSEVNHTNDGVLVTFVFTVSENAPEGETPITIEYYAESTFNADLDPVEFEVDNGSVKIVKRLAGDANGNGFVNLKDAVIIERYLAGGWAVTVEAENADVNGDGKVSLMDSVLIKRYLANWDIELI